jgi:hypothetical protein
VRLALSYTPQRDGPAPKNNGVFTILQSKMADEEQKTAEEVQM